MGKSTAFRVAGILMGYRWFFERLMVGVHACHGGTYPRISSTLTPFRVMESSPPIFDDPGSALTFVALVELHVDLFFHGGEFG